MEDATKSEHSKPVSVECGVRGAELAEEVVLKNCDTCRNYDFDDDEYPCAYCDGFSRWEVAPNLIGP